jgi:hypothetical protein
MKSKYATSLHGETVEPSKDLHEALMGLEKKGYKTVKSAMDAGYQLHRMEEHKHADELRHTNGGSHDPYYKAHKE